MDRQSRVTYLRQQAEQLRTLGEFSHDAILRVQFLELADRCNAIAANITENIPIHERLRESTPMRTKKWVGAVRAERRLACPAT
jgi:hypothetical protein